MSKYCVNIDWFEVFTYEPADCTGPEWYEALGFKVVRRSYGTRVFNQMFTLIGKDGLPWLEVRRDPASKKSSGGVLFDGACKLRLVNRACYDWFPVAELYDFLSSLGFHYKKYQLCAISRVDLCVDFLDGAMIWDNVRPFDPSLKDRGRILNDSGTPSVVRGTECIYRDSVSCSDFIKLYTGGAMWKIGAAKMQAWGEEFSDGIHYHALKFGSTSSMVSTKLYNKTLEMAQVHVKPWIVESWVKAGLLHDEQDTTPVWRLEFSVQSGVDEWVCERNLKTEEPFTLSNTIEAWQDTANYSRFLRGLISHYFCFATKETASNKYRCHRFCPLLYSAGMAFKPIHLHNVAKEHGRTEKIVLNKLQRLYDDGKVPERYKPAFDSVMWLLQSLYGIRNLCESRDFDTEEIKRVMATYNEELIEEMFDAVICDHSRPKEHRDLAELCYSVFHRDFVQFARELYENKPYSITAVRLAARNKMSVEERITLRHIKAQLARKNGEILLEYEE